MEIKDENEEDQRYNISPALKWTPLETPYEQNQEEGNRWMRACPIYFDGEFLRTLVRYTEKAYNDKVVKYVLESYQVSDDSVTFESQMPLCKYEQEQDQVVNWLDENFDERQATIVTNDSYLIICMSQTVFSFDIRSGKVGKYLSQFELNMSRCIYCYDQRENAFYEQDVAGVGWISFLKKFQLRGFERCSLKPPIVLSDFKNILKEVIGESKNDRQNVKEQ